MVDFYCIIIANYLEKLSQFNNLAGVNLTEQTPRSRVDKKILTYPSNIKTKNFEMQMK